MSMCAGVCLQDSIGTVGVADLLVSFQAATSWSLARSPSAQLAGEHSTRR
jgi:hypothetical protein